MKKAILYLLLGLFSFKRQFAQSLHFDGTDDFVTTSLTLNSSTFTNWTFECWVISPQAPSSSIGLDGPIYSESMGILWNHNPGFSGSAFVQATSGVYYTASFGSLDPNTWYHLAATYDGNSLKTYRNGTLITVTVTSGGVFPSSNILKLGRHPSVGHFFEGSIDEVRVWNTVRTCNEINDNMNSELVGNETGLMLYHKFNDGLPAANNTAISTILNSQNNLNDGVVSGFAMNGTASNFGNNAPFNLPTATCLNTQSSLNFDGVNDYVQTPLIINSSNYSNITFECWVKSPNLPSNADYDGPMSGDNFGITWNHVNSAFQGAAFVKTGPSSWYSVSFGPMATNTWYHLAATFDGTYLIAYKNGAVMNTFTVPGSLYSTTSPLKIGSSIQGDMFEGNVDEVRVWNTARTCSEINANMNSELNGNEQGLTLYYKFNDALAYANNSATTNVYNSVSGNTDGILTNFGLTGTLSNFSDQSPFNAAVTCGTTGIHTEIIPDKMKIFPNPTSSLLNIEVEEQAKIIILNILGEIVQTEIINGTNTIDVSNLTPGVYFIQSTTGAKAKFIKN